MNILKIVEIVDLGIEKEKRRRDFYGLVAEKMAASKELKDLFSQLRDWEEAHIKKFTEVRNSLDEDEGTEGYPGELSEYMQSVVGEKLYSDITAETMSVKIKTPLDATYYGIGFEKDAILFFSELLNYTKGSHKEVIQKLIDEEKQHIVYLALLQQKLLGKTK